MTHQDIIRHLCLKYPPEVIHEITTENIISAIVRRMGEEALNLTSTELELAAQEVRSVFEDDDREKDLISIAIDSWEIVRNL